MDQVFTDEQRTLVEVTVERVVKGELTRDDAQRLLTNAGIPVLKKEHHVGPN
jgi:hypothetical protein